MGPQLPDTPRLAAAAAVLERARVGGWICDERWRVVWVSPQTVMLSGGASDDDLGVGQHVLVGLGAPYWAGSLEPEDVVALVPGLCAWIAGSGTAGDGADPHALYEAVAGEPLVADPSPVFHGSLRWQARAGEPTMSRTLWFRLRDGEGAFAGAVAIADADLPTEVGFFLTRGDHEALRRMVRLIEPRRRAAAILFVDLQNSGVLARRLTAAAYFELVQRLTRTIDAAVVEHGGSVGKHAGDGVTAFFTTEELGSESGAARAAIEAARAVRAAVDAVEGPGTDALRVNAGAHWSSGLYMGQLVTDGRLEVTALGDAVNECARLQETARDGEILASKALLEQLSAADAEAIGLEPDAVVFTLLSEREGVPPKALRDAGSIPVTVLR